MLSKQQVLDRLPVKSHVSLWSWVKDGKFPPPHEIGGGALGWIEEQVDNHLVGTPVRLPKGSTVTP
jgi:predicted DNA-binding transcriptional regulator AlpA